MKLAKKITPWIVFMLLLAVSMKAQSPIGKWKTIDDETGDQKSIVEIFEKDGKLYGKIIQLFRKPTEEQDPVCDECDEDDPRYNKRVLGMVILEGLKKGSDNVWEDGEILDPKNGSVYSCYIELIDKNKLKLRGYLGFSLIGRTQYWYRVE
ncbi:MAG: DUF2147 domain-containing protein [Bacteroidia bacterium]|nr:DUF2147 domain-containing protein [Bacteroidia bacterium]